MTTIEKIRAEIEREMGEITYGVGEPKSVYEFCEQLLAFLDNLETEEKDTFCKENCKGYQDTGGCFCDGGCEAKKKAEEKDVDLENAIQDWMLEIDGKYAILTHPPVDRVILETAYHFYDLGCRRTADMYDDIEYNRQRAEEAWITKGLECETKK